MGKPNSTASDILTISVVIVSEAYELSLSEYIGLKKRTRRTETSQYPEEKKSTEIPLVVASERGSGQWPIATKSKVLGNTAKVGDSPVDVLLLSVLE